MAIQDRDPDDPIFAQIEAITERNEEIDNVVRLRIQGASVDEISQETMLTPVRIKQILSNSMALELADQTAQERQGLVALEVARLDALFRTFFPVALQGDIDSAKMALAISKERSELQRLKQVEANPGGVTNNVLVIGGDEASFLAGLEQARAMIEKRSDYEDED